MEINRMIALGWWNRLKLNKKFYLASYYFKDKTPNMLTGLEIENIWINENENY